MNLSKLIEDVKAKGYRDDDARAKICQDIIIKAISRSTFSKKITVKGGVVMSSITQNIRRATQDIDMDFLRYNLSDDSIDRFIRKINCIKGIIIEREGDIEDLKNQDYNGKRVYIHIKDLYGNFIESKVDLGVHKYIEIEQEEFCFDIAFDNDGASLLINTKEQMFVEKLKSLLKFGTFSTRYKDIYDMHYLINKLNDEKLLKIFITLIFSDNTMRENNMIDVFKRVKNIFADSIYKKRVDTSDKRWIDDNIDEVFNNILSYLNKLSHIIL